MNENTMPLRQLMFSLITGDLYQIESDELKNMDRYQIPLIHCPKSSCNRCFGRMHAGFNDELKIFILCPKCTHKCVDFNLLKNANIDVETIKHD